MGWGERENGKSNKLPVLGPNRERERNGGGIKEKREEACPAARQRL